MLNLSPVIASNIVNSCAHVFITSRIMIILNFGFEIIFLENNLIKWYTYHSIYLYATTSLFSTRRLLRVALGRTFKQG